MHYKKPTLSAPLSDATYTTQYHAHKLEETIRQHKIAEQETRGSSVLCERESCHGSQGCLFEKF